MITPVAHVKVASSVRLALENIVVSAAAGSLL